MNLIENHYEVSVQLINKYSGHIEKLDVFAENIGEAFLKAEKYCKNDVDSFHKSIIIKIELIDQIGDM